MDFSYKINLILKEEALNLREFSDLAGIHYQTASQYKSGRRTPTLQQVLKIIEVDRFSKYKNLLLSLNEPISDDSPEQLKAREPHADYNLGSSQLKNEAIELINRLDDIGRGEEALAVLQAIEAAAAKR